MADFKNDLTLNGSAVLTALTGYTKTQLSTSGQSSVHFGNLTSKPTTLAGYGITDAPTKTGSGATGTWDIAITGNAATTSQTTFPQVYTDGWFRNNGQNLGLYSQYYGNHFYAESAQRWTMASGSGYPSLCFRTENQGTPRGYVYSDATGFGLLHSGGNWMFYANGNDSVTFPGNITTKYVTTSQNGSGGYALYERNSSNRWTMYSASSALRFSCDATGIDLLTLNQWGQVGIRTAPGGNASLLVQGISLWDSGYYGLVIQNGAGATTMYVRDDGYAWVRNSPLQYSDARRKKDIADIDSPLALIGALRPRSFVMRDDPSEKLRYGLIAQEAVAVVPSLVDLSVLPGQDEAEYSFNYVGLIGPLIGAVQELAARVLALETKRSC